MDDLNRPPNELRNFVHKRLLRAAGGFITGGPVAALSGFVAPTSAPLRVQPPGLRPQQRSFISQQLAVRQPTRRTLSRSLTARPGPTSSLQKAGARSFKFGLPGGVEVSLPCIFPTRRDPRTGECRVFAGEQTGRDDTPIGDAVMGRYGAGEVPGSMVIDRAVCRRGMVLGDDGICYNRSQVSNANRQWPRGRRPLLTGGDMRAISTAARAGKRLEGATKRLQKIGLMKKPAPRAARRVGPTEVALLQAQTARHHLTS